MIKKIKSIRKIAVYENFDWDNSVKDKNGKIEEFKKINIFFGRNYSGKTTLSRIIRALETGTISEKYGNYKQFAVSIDDKTVTQENPLEHTKVIRVFNEDFVRENISFPYNDDGNIKSFAIMGDSNNEIQSKINEIIAELGTNDEGENKTGLYREQELANEQFKQANQNLEKEEKELNNELSNKASGDRQHSIKYRSDLYGDQNYNINKLKADIICVLAENFIPISDEDKEQKIKLLHETTKAIIPNIKVLDIDFTELLVRSKKLIEQDVIKKEDITELISNDLINWAKRGKELHQKGNRCAFCGNIITDTRWNSLNNYFDSTIEILERNIDALIVELENNRQRIDSITINESLFYSFFQRDLQNLNLQQVKDNAKKAVLELEDQLLAKKASLFENKKITPPTDFSNEFNQFINDYNRIAKENNSYSDELQVKQTNAKQELRLKEVYDFLSKIGYKKTVEKIEQLKLEKNKKEDEKRAKDILIHSKEEEITKFKNKMNDEEKGAKKVKEYLYTFFGNQHISLEAEKDMETDSHYKFLIFRDGVPAYNLSEGECRLIAFCYFMAKLEDTATSGKKPIIWIDDPISSLDSNHIFFVYSMIYQKIIADENYEQLFISTHNLTFLKYLKRLKGKKLYLCVNRQNNESILEKMPKYLEEYVTEFNYLFKQIYECAHVNEIKDNNYSIFYNFGNNARKFLEIYLYYKFPDMYNCDKDESVQEKRRKKFFGDGIESIYTNRLVNEYSHLCGTFERGEMPVDVPEMRAVANLILNTIETRDKEQYDALVNSIN
ncbi:AAA family ATPase [Treponema sp. OMZ 787]|uniref:AAA family ATPase n=1 Tax=Treponema sp. OMZ 787 TaxID=2563669 RepID=UPI0020A33861|nr:AAA family ATPase [Treponema sp. OMZ 787]UTC62038.1 AAA family ATPase [Treponema sp. OMZ 787]